MFTVIRRIYRERDGCGDGIGYVDDEWNLNNGFRMLVKVTCFWILWIEWG